MQRKSYFKSPYDRVGQFNHKTVTIPTTKPMITKDDSEPDHIIIVTKRKGFGTTGNKESDPMSQHSAVYLLTSFPKDKFMRYKVNIYLKDK